jgi:predicted negative regulator of RcsB-dependent stress response
VIDIRGNLAAALIHVGQLAAAEQHLQKTEQLLLASGASQNFRIALGEYNLACVQARQGKKDMAIETLHRSLDHGLLADAALHMDADDDLVSLQADVRFKALLARAHLMYPAPAAPGNP